MLSTNTKGQINHVKDLSSAKHVSEFVSAQSYSEQCSFDQYSSALTPSQSSLQISAHDFSNSEFIEESQFPDLILNRIPLLDVRSESEFSRSNMPFSVNIPILSDPERAAVGTCYKQKGKELAMSLGHSLVGGEVKEKRISEWTAFLRFQRHPILFCARGGLRSKISQEWISNTGQQVSRVRGGYKALRNFFLGYLESQCPNLPLVLVSGPTGSGKTRLLQDLSLVPKLARPTCEVLDLERLANHKGSAFGDNGAQPFQATFENLLSAAVLFALKNEPQIIAIESESRAIGRVWLPVTFYNQMQIGPAVVVDTEFSQRIDNIIDDYVVAGLKRHSLITREEAILRLQAELVESLRRISRRLGHERANKIIQLVEQAMSQFTSKSDLQVHRCWVEPLLKEYYDPFYTWHERNRAERVVFRGSSSAVREFLCRYRNSN